MVIYERDDGSTLHLPYVLVEANTHDAYVLLAIPDTRGYQDSHEDQEAIP